jgi:hypothetical protein
MTNFGMLFHILDNYVVVHHLQLKLNQFHYFWGGSEDPELLPWLIFHEKCHQMRWKFCFVYTMVSDGQFHGNGYFSLEVKLSSFGEKEKAIEGGIGESCFHCWTLDGKGCF